MVFLGALAISIALSENSSAQDGQVVNEKALYEESSRDFQAFLDKYSGRTLAIHGSVLVTTVSDYVDSKVQLDYFVTCYPAREQQQLLATIKQRDAVTVRGVISESFLGRIYLRPCTVETAAAPAPPVTTGAPPLGKYECWSWSQAQLTLAFTLASNGVYYDYEGQAGRYSYDQGTLVVSMRGAALDGSQLRFASDPRPNLTYRKPDGSFDMGIACDFVG